MYGPLSTQGLVERPDPWCEHALPHHLDWSGHAEYDLSRPARLARMYEVVLTEPGITGRPQETATIES